jgi:hypothetical protein
MCPFEFNLEMNRCGGVEDGPLPSERHESALALFCGTVKPDVHVID